MRVCVQGFGSMGKRHAHAARQIGHQVEIADDSPAALDAARQAGFAVHDGDEAEAVIIATPAQCHAPAIGKALERKQHIFVEKPIATSVYDLSHHVKDLSPVQTAQVGYNMRWHKGVRQLRYRIQSGELGTLFAARFCCSVNGSTWLGSAYADTLIECSHEVDLAMYLLGSGCCVAARTVGEGLRSSWDLLVEHDSGVISSIHLDTVRDGYLRYCEVIGSKATATCDLRDMPTAAADTYIGELAHFFVCVASGVESACTLIDGVRALAVCDEARRVARKSDY